MSNLRKSARQARDARSDKGIAKKEARDGANLHKDFVEAKRNQSQQEKRNELASARRNFLNGQEEPRSMKPKQQDLRESSAERPTQKRAKA